MKDESSRPTLRSFLADSEIPPERFLEALDLLKDEIRELLERSARPSPPAVASPEVHPSPPVGPASTPPDAADENESIRRILEEVKAGWIRQDRAKARPSEVVAPPASRFAAPPPPPADEAVSTPGEEILQTVIRSSAPPSPSAKPTAAPPEGERISMETVILAPSPGAKVPPLRSGPPPTPAPADDQPTAFIRTGTPPPGPSVPPPPEDARGEMLLETMIGTTGKAPRGPQPHADTPASASPELPEEQQTTIIRVGPQPPQPAKAPPKPPAEDALDQTVMIRPDPHKGKGKGGPK